MACNTPAGVMMLGCCNDPTPVNHFFRIMVLYTSWSNNFAPVNQNLATRYPILRQAMDDFDMYSIIDLPASGGGFVNVYKAFYNTDTGTIGTIVQHEAQGINFAEDQIAPNDSNRFIGNVFCSKMRVGTPLGITHRVQFVYHAQHGSEVFRCENRRTEYIVQSDPIPDLSLPISPLGLGTRYSTASWTSGYDPLCVDNF